MKEEFKPGDMVMIVSHEAVEGSDMGRYRTELPLFTPLEIESEADSNANYGVWNEDKSDWWPVPAANLCRVSSAAQPAAEITLDGHRYVLAPEQAKAKEEKREPKEGEIWCWGRTGDLYLITSGHGGLYAHNLRRGTLLSRTPAGRDTDLTYAYPDLAAAIKAGETFE